MRSQLFILFLNEHATKDYLNWNIKEWKRWKVSFTNRSVPLPPPQKKKQLNCDCLKKLERLNQFWKVKTVWKKQVEERKMAAEVNDHFVGNKEKGKIDTTTTQKKVFLFLSVKFSFNLFWALKNRLSQIFFYFCLFFLKFFVNWSISLHILLITNCSEKNKGGLILFLEPSMD